MTHSDNLSPHSLHFILHTCICLLIFYVLFFVCIEYAWKRFWKITHTRVCVAFFINYENVLYNHVKSIEKTAKYLYNQTVFLINLL